MNIDVNYVAVLLAGVAATVVGFLWYSPLLLGKPWMKQMGYSSADLKSEQKKMGKYYVVSFVLSLLMAYVLYHVMVMGMNFFQYPKMMSGLSSAFWMWLGFVMPVQATTTIFSTEKKWGLFAINTGYQLVSLLAMGVVLGML